MYTCGIEKVSAFTAALCQSRGPAVFHQTRSASVPGTITCLLIPVFLPREAGKLIVVNWACPEQSFYLTDDALYLVGPVSFKLFNIKANTARHSPLIPAFSSPHHRPNNESHHLATRPQKQPPSCPTATPTRAPAPTARYILLSKHPPYLASLLTTDTNAPHTQGNHYCARDYGSGASNSNSYHYSNTYERAPKSPLLRASRLTDV